MVKLMEVIMLVIVIDVLVNKQGVNVLPSITLIVNVSKKKAFHLAPLLPKQAEPYFHGQPVVAQQPKLVALCCTGNQVCFITKTILTFVTCQHRGVKSCWSELVLSTRCVGVLLLLLLLHHLSSSSSMLKQLFVLRSRALSSAVSGISLSASSSNSYFCFFSFFFW